MKIQKKLGGRVRWGESGWWGEWVRVDVNAMLGVGGDVVYGGCEPSVGGIVFLGVGGRVRRGSGSGLEEGSGWGGGSGWM